MILFHFKKAQNLETQPDSPSEIGLHTNMEIQVIFRRFFPHGFSGKGCNNFHFKTDNSMEANVTNLFILKQIKSLHFKKFKSKIKEEEDYEFEKPNLLLGFHLVDSSCRLDVVFKDGDIYEKCDGTKVEIRDREKIFQFIGTLPEPVQVKKKKTFKESNKGFLTSIGCYLQDRC